jgi:D-alanyl-lipoteichoic acid acyltransferase DltB (MBOAT superfamily)
MVVANWLAENLADPVFAQPDAFASGADILIGIYAYAIQIYCDFSAYSDIAIGCAILMGFHFPINFNAPYFGVTLQDFWRRWHISLSTWLRDYLYIPLGGSRAGASRTWCNLLLTFVLGGLWHGAAWTFVLWGAFHGGYLALERVVRRACGLSEKPAEHPRRVLAFLGQIWIFHVVCFSWILFRSPDLTACGEMVRGLGRWEVAPTLWTARALLVLLVGFSLQGLDGDRMQGVWRRFNAMPVVAQGAITAVVLTVILALGPVGVAPFIYFQF